MQRSNQNMMGVSNAGQQQRQPMPNIQENFQNHLGPNQYSATVPVPQYRGYVTDQGEAVPVAVITGNVPYPIMFSLCAEPVLANVQQFGGQQMTQTPSEQQQYQAWLQYQQAEPTQQLPQHIQEQCSRSGCFYHQQFNCQYTPLTPNELQLHQASQHQQQEHLADGTPLLPGLLNLAPTWHSCRMFKRLRRLEFFRNIFQAKSAVAVLNEMGTGVQFTYPEAQSSMTETLFLVKAEIRGKTYIGQGSTTFQARQNAAENALRSLFFEYANTLSQREGSSSQNGENSENSEEAEVIPWYLMLNFALYKLFEDWHNQENVMPVPAEGVSTGEAVERMHRRKGQKELPTALNPIILLNQMIPGLIYTEFSHFGNENLVMYLLKIDGVEYTGTAKNKRDAKRNVAKAALEAIYGLRYPEEPKFDHAEGTS